MLELGQTIETERLILRRYCAEEFQDLYEYLSDEETVRFEPYRAMSPDETQEELTRRIASDEMIAVALKSSNRLIGNVYFWKDSKGNPIWKDTLVYALLNNRI